MYTLEEQIMTEIKGQCILIRTEAMRLEEIPRIPGHTVEDIEEQLGKVSELIGFLNADINRYWVKKKAQSRQAPQDWDNQLTASPVGVPAAAEHTVTSQQAIVIPASEEDFMSEIKGRCIIVMTEAIHLEDKTRNPDLTVEDIEEQLGIISELIGFLNDYIEQYRTQLHQAAQATDN